MNKKAKALLNWATSEELLNELASRDEDYYIIQKTDNAFNTFCPNHWSTYEIMVLLQVIQSEIMADIKDELKIKKKGK